MVFLAPELLSANYSSKKSREDANSDLIGPKADVYSVGVILYLLVTRDFGQQIRNRSSETGGSSSENTCRFTFSEAVW